MKNSIGILVYLLLPLIGSSAQQKPPAKNPLPPPAQEDPCKKPLDQGKINSAIKKGCQYLLANLGDIPPMREVGKPPKLTKVPDDGHTLHLELALLTLIHGGAFSENNDKCKKLLQYVLNWNPRYTYRAAVKAMALAALDKNKYIEYIAQCGDFLVTAQRDDGGWDYESDTPITFEEKPKVRIATGDKTSATKIKLKSLAPQVKTPRPMNIHPRSDNSNSQYASLGLRACRDAGIEIPKETIKLAKQWWEKSQFPDGGWDYEQSGGGLQATTTKQNKIPEKKGISPAAMTAGGVSSLAIYAFLLGEAKSKNDFTRNASLAAGIKWLNKDFEKADHATYWENLYLAYSIERAGIMAEFTKIGDHDWYKEGVDWILNHQQSDGNWQSKFIGERSIGTCFAILFLKRATEALIDTGQKPDPPPEPPKDIDSGDKGK